MSDLAEDSTVYCDFPFCGSFIVPGTPEEEHWECWSYADGHQTRLCPLHSKKVQDAPKTVDEARERDREEALRWYCG